MAPQQAGMGGIIQGGYDSDVEGGNAYNDTAGFESFSDKAVSYISLGSFKKPNHVIRFQRVEIYLINIYHLCSSRSAVDSFEKFMAY